MVKTFEQVSGKKIPFEMCPRRAGDIARCFADPSFATKTLHWQATKSVQQMVEDSWNWQKNNPQGYE